MATVAKAPSALDFIKSKAKPSSAKKDGKPVLADESLADLLRDYKQHKDAAESHEALAATIKDQITMPASRFLFEVAGKKKEIVSTIEIQAGGRKMAYTLQNSYSAVPIEQKPRLEEMFGAEVSRYFVDHLEISIKPDSAVDEQFLSELMLAVGQENFDKHFSVKCSMKVTESFHQAYLTDEAFRAQVQPLVDDQTIKPRSPSLKVS